MTSEPIKKKRSLLTDLDKANRYLFTKYSFINNRKLLLLWSNAMVIFYLLNLVAPDIGYSNFTFILAIVFLVIEVGEVLSRRKPRTEIVK